ncbi:hypothetical protein M199_gp258 [Halogranum tailed virus 1]|uniref:Uncharacterized protein n=1 Tax=Halogranum tailed virus 1 TaxID=1273749 RepID=R4TMM3_9CAUD|nr:hypothetical protein M199_gp258 [Halogranum tailed virus 1]AGM11408.1 hypothetical protein HGTV1_110 [Halogranum tailed virus 1]
MSSRRIHRAAFATIASSRPALTERVILFLEVLLFLFADYLAYRILTERLK